MAVESQAGDEPSSLHWPNIVSLSLSVDALTEALLVAIRARLFPDSLLAFRHAHRDIQQSLDMPRRYFNSSLSLPELSIWAFCTVSERASSFLLSTHQRTWWNAESGSFGCDQQNRQQAKGTLSSSLRNVRSDDDTENICFAHQGIGRSGSTIGKRRNVGS